jgi:transcription antitermination factor NusG
MAKQHNVPFRLFKRGEIYHAYISFIAADGTRINVRRTTGEVLPEKAAQFCLKYIEQLNTKAKLAEGDKVEIVEGPLDTMIGEVVGIIADEAGSRAKVKVEMFGRETIVDLDYSQLRKITD